MAPRMAPTKHQVQLKQTRKKLKTAPIAAPMKAPAKEARVMAKKNSLIAQDRRSLRDLALLMVCPFLHQWLINAELIPWINPVSLKFISN